jgi:hypothetical protein
MRSRIPAALMLAALITAALPDQPTAFGQESKSPKDKDKEPTKEPTKIPTPKWPTEISGKNMDAWLKDVIHPDPAIRESALRTLPSFGPSVQKAAGKLLVVRMTREPDPGVRMVVYQTIAAIGFDESDKNDEKEAIRLLSIAIDNAPAGSYTRLQAVQAISAFGPKAYDAVGQVAGQSATDPSYETRRAIANTLSRIGFSETHGPNQKALDRLSGTLARDPSVSVRMEALQSLVLLGPPWAEKLPPKAKNPPKINQEGADIVADNMRHRLGIAKGKSAPVGAPEPDKQLEIWCRVVLMRFDPKEITDKNLDAIAKHIDPKNALGPKLQALQALALFGERAGDQCGDVVTVLGEGDPLVVSTALQTLAAMGIKAHGAVPELVKMEQKWAKLREERMKANLKDKQFLDFYTKLEEKEKKQVIDSLAEEQTRKGIEETIKWIRASKEGKPGGDLANPPAAPAPEPKKVP